jgi:hypothetical protein
VSTSLVDVARTLATGHFLGVVHVNGHRGRLRVRHATPADGTPLLLTRSTGTLAAALVPPPGECDTAVVLAVDGRHPDLPGRLWLSGWAEPLAGEEARAAALEYAAVNPTEDLLGVGRGHALYRVEVGEVRLAFGSTLVELDVDEFRAASPLALDRSVTGGTLLA